MRRTIVLVSDFSEDLLFAKGVADALGASLLQTESGIEGRRLLSEVHQPLLFVDVSSSAIFEEFCMHLAGVLNSECVHFIRSDADRSGRLLKGLPWFGHWVIRSHRDPRAAGEFYGAALQPVVTPGVPPQRFLIRSSSDKLGVIESIKRNLIEEKVVRERIANCIINCLDELVMNAIYDATEELEGFPFEAIERNAEVSFRNGKEVEILLSWDPERISLTVTDHCGSANQLKLLKHLSLDDVNAPLKVTPNTVRAGVGLAITVKAGGSLTFVTRPGERTDVTLSFKRESNFKEFREQFRFVSVQMVSPPKAVDLERSTPKRVLSVVPKAA